MGVRGDSRFEYPSWDWMLLSWQGLGKWMSFMTWTRLTFHGIVNDCDLGEVSVYTPRKGCVELYVVRIIYVG